MPVVEMYIWKLQPPVEVLLLVLSESIWSMACRWGRSISTLVKTLQFYDCSNLWILFCCSLKYFLSVVSSVVSSGISNCLQLVLWNYSWALMKKVIILHHFEDVNRGTGKLAQTKWYHYLLHLFKCFYSWYIRNLIEFFCIKIDALSWSVLAVYISVTVLFS